MIRQHLAEALEHDPDFEWRGGQVSRIEGLSDAVFAFALTLLVVSLAVPSTFEELWKAIRGFFAFALCFAMLIWMWYSHYIFFRRFGLQDRITITLNAALLFVILFYVYPLKYVATQLVAWVVDGTPPFPGHGARIMVIYSSGLIAVFGLLALMHVNAWKRRARLELTTIEQAHTRYALRSHLLTATVGAVSILLAWVGPAPKGMWAGWVYALLGPVHGIHGWRSGVRIERLKAG